MGVEEPGDFAIFMDPEDFAEAATYLRQSEGAPVAINGIWRAPYEGVADIGDVEVGATDPSLLVFIADLPAGYGPKDSVTVKGQSWTVRRIEPESDGITARVYLTGAA